MISEAKASCSVDLSRDSLCLEEKFQIDTRKEYYEFLQVESTGVI